MNDVLVADGAAEPRVGLTEGQRLVDTFIAPSKTFTDIRRSASWWVPFLLLVIVSYGFTFAVQKKVGFPTLVENAIKSNPSSAERMANSTPEQAATTKRFMEASFRYSFYAAPILSLAFFAIGALVLWASLNFGFGGTATFKQLFAVSVYAWLPLTLKSIVTMVLLFAGGDPEGFDLQNQIGTNPGFYMPSESAAWLKALLTSLDLFTIWSLVLLSIGCAIVARLKTSQAAIVVFGWWFLIVLIKVAYSAFTG